MVLLIGPFVAAVGLVAVFFVMRHRSVQTKSMYSARRAQIERKVRAARQRTLTPTGKHAEAAAVQAPQEFVSPGMEAKGAVPTATWGPPTARPETAPPPPPPLPPEQVWEVGPTAPAPTAPEPSPPTFAPSEPPPPPVAPDSEWTPARFEPATPRPEPAAGAQVEAPVSTPAGGGASWSIVGESKDTEEPVAEKKPKKDKEKAQTGSWSLASGDLPGEESDDEVKGPSTAVALAQYAVLVVGLVMVLIGVLVMVANSHFT